MRSTNADLLCAMSTESLSPSPECLSLSEEESVGLGVSMALPLRIFDGQPSAAHLRFVSYHHHPVGFPRSDPLALLAGQSQYGLKRHPRGPGHHSRKLSKSANLGLQIAQTQLCICCLQNPIFTATRTPSPSTPGKVARARHRYS